MSVSPNIARVLIVDDEPHMRLLSEFCLRKGGFHNFFFGVNGLEAVRFAHEIHPHLIIIDYMMPEMDGLSAMRQIRAAEDTAHIPIIMISGHGEFHSQSPEVAAATAVLKKPYNPSLLVETAQLALAERIPALSA